MSEFFKSRRFKVLAVVLAVVIALSGVSAVFGKKMEPQSSAVGAILVPVQRFSSWCSGKIADFITANRRAERLEKENYELRGKERELIDNMLDYDTCKRENDYLKKFLEIKEDHPDYKFCNANVIASDSADGCVSYTIDCGSRDGVELHDTVISGDGLIGYVSKVYRTYCTVMTLLDSSLSLGATCSRTGDYGIVSGYSGGIESVSCKMDYLSANTGLSRGDYIITSGLGGVFPEGLVIGTVTEVRKDEGSISAYATVKLSADLEELTDVMVITSFDGQNEKGVDADK